MSFSHIRPIVPLAVVGGLLGFQIIKYTNFIGLNNRDTAVKGGNIERNRTRLRI